MCFFGWFGQIEFEEKRKAEGKKARDDKNAVLDMMFAAFEKHQYYNIKDLVRITKQPVVCDLRIIYSLILINFYPYYIKEFFHPLSLDIS